MLLIRSVSARCGGPALLSPCVLLLRVIERRRAEMQKAHLIFIRVSFA